MNTQKILSFFKANMLSFIIGLFFYLLYLQFTYSGNRMCDCASTEKYNATHGTYRSAAGVNRFYHK